jgi:hypothetical protein
VAQSRLSSWSDPRATHLSSISSYSSQLQAYQRVDRLLSYAEPTRLATMVLGAISSRNCSRCKSEVVPTGRRFTFSSQCSAPRGSPSDNLEQQGHLDLLPVDKFKVDSKKTKLVPERADQSKLYQCTIGQRVHAKSFFSQCSAAVGCFARDRSPESQPLLPGKHPARGEETSRLLLSFTVQNKCCPIVRSFLSRWLG